MENTKQIICMLLLVISCMLCNIISATTIKVVYYFVIYDIINYFMDNYFHIIVEYLSLLCNSVIYTYQTIHATLELYNDEYGLV